MTNKTPKQVEYEADLVGLAVSIVQNHYARLSTNSADEELIANQAIFIMAEIEQYELHGEISPTVFQSASNLFSNFCAQYQDEEHRFMWGNLDDELRRIASESSFS